jgi:hypothetical protein
MQDCTSDECTPDDWMATWSSALWWTDHYRAGAAGGCRREHGLERGHEVIGVGDIAGRIVQPSA